MPKVSVIMGVYNTPATFLCASIESILNQTMEELEFIIIDDCSSDKRITRILDNYSRKDKRIILNRNTKNLGLAKSLNNAIKDAKTSYIARMDADDIALPMRLESQFAFLEIHSHIAMVGTACLLINKTDEVIGRESFPLSDTEIRIALIRRNCICHPSVMIRTKVFEAVGLYNESYQHAQDYELWFRVLQKFKVANLSDTLLMRRIHPLMVGLSANKLQARGVLKARLKAISEGQYPLINCVYLANPLATFLIPNSLRRILWRFKGISAERQ